MEKKQIKGLKRNTIDKYYTKDIIVDSCLQNVKKHIDISMTDDVIIEPSAGDGSFISGIKEMSQKFIFYDIEPEHSEIVKQDYLKVDDNFAFAYANANANANAYANANANANAYANANANTKSKIHVIGNPPFGRQSSLAIQFIKKSSRFCDSISFILPKSFKKDSLKKTFPLKFHLVFETDLPDKSFLVDGVEYTVPCIFQIWQKKTNNREVKDIVEPNHFTFVKNTENPDISFRRVGVNAGTIDTNIENKSVQSHYFIKFTNKKTVEENVKQLSTIKYDFNNTVGPKSISKQELIAEFNALL